MVVGLPAVKLQHLFTDPSSWHSTSCHCSKLHAGMQAVRSSGSACFQLLLIDCLA